MQVDLFVSNKMTHIPIIECGGRTLAPGEKLFVDKETAEQLKNKYGSNLVHAQTVERDTLDHGNWEIQSNQFGSVQKNRDMSRQMIMKVK